MAASNPNGEQQFWFNGLPFEGLAKTTPLDEGAQQYWFNGLPGEYIYPAVTPAATTTIAPVFTLLGAGV